MAMESVLISSVWWTYRGLKPIYSFNFNFENEGFAVSTGKWTGPGGEASYQFIVTSYDDFAFTLFRTDGEVR